MNYDSMEDAIYCIVNTAYEHTHNKRALGPRIAQLNPRTWRDDVLACGLRDTI